MIALVAEQHFFATLGDDTKGSRPDNMTKLSGVRSND